VKIVALKDLRWTGKIAEVRMPGRLPFKVRLDGVAIGNQLTGRVVGNPRERWFFTGENRDEPGLPSWVVIIEGPNSRVFKSVVSASTDKPVAPGQMFLLEMGPMSIVTNFDRVMMPEVSARRVGELEIWRRRPTEESKKFIMLKMNMLKMNPTVVATSWYAEEVPMLIGDSIVVSGRNVGEDDHVFRCAVFLTVSKRRGL
jgi:hypothetical protein